MLKNCFLSKKKVLNAILRAKLKYMQKTVHFIRDKKNSNAEDRFS